MFPTATKLLEPVVVIGGSLGGVGAIECVPGQVPPQPDSKATAKDANTVRLFTPNLLAAAANEGAFDRDLHFRLPGGFISPAEQIAKTR